MFKKTDVLIIGAGTYGIAVAVEMERLGIDHLLMGKPFWFWRHHILPEVSLRSPISDTEMVTHDGRFDWARYLEERGKPPESSERVPMLSEFVDYTHWIESKLDLAQDESLVTKLSRHGEEFIAETSAGDTITARNVVIATGVAGHQQMPYVLTTLPEDMVAHSYEVERYTGLTGKKLVVIGGGQSAAEVVAHLEEDNEVTWVHRPNVVFYKYPVNMPAWMITGLQYVASAYYYVPRRLRQLIYRFEFAQPTIDPSLKPLVLNDKVTEVTNDAEGLGLSVKDDRLHSSALQRDFDMVIACTGFRVRVDNYPYLDRALGSRIAQKDGYPLLDYNYQTNVPGLFMTGAIAEMQHGPFSRFLSGTRHSAVYISKELRNRLQA